MHWRKRRLIAEIQAFGMSEATRTDARPAKSIYTNVVYDIVRPLQVTADTARAGTVRS